MRTLIVVSATLLTACPRPHYGPPDTPHGNDILLDAYGLPATPTSQFRCPSQAAGEGEIKLTFGDGKTRVKGECRGGLMVGTWKAWYQNGAKVWEATFKHGVLDGEFESWHPNDQKQAQLTYREGRGQGTFKAWWYNGEKRAQGDFLAGQKNGCWELWHDNGQKAMKGTYSDDQQVETWLSWTASGQKSKQKLGGTAAHGACLITF
jgi:hypothetical protein